MYMTSILELFKAARTQGTDEKVHAPRTKIERRGFNEEIPLERWSRTEISPASFFDSHPVYFRYRMRDYF